MVAHRLRTVIDCDKVLVLERGRVTEQSHPHELLQQQGPFSSMVAEGGPEVTVYFNWLILYLVLCGNCRTIPRKSDVRHCFECGCQAQWLSSVQTSARTAYFFNVCMTTEL
jgi:energy-coupling factor transporter ATP-binding protein EcfA2